MRRLIDKLMATRPHNERGATAVTSAILMVVLLAFAAVAIDVGLLYANRAQLQNGADSAALAIANDCAKGTCEQSADEIKAAGFAKMNSNDALAKFKSVTKTANSVTVEVGKDGAGSNPVRLVFANIFGTSEADVSATATASWGPPSSGTTFPWTFGKCVFDSALSTAQLTELADTGSFTGNGTRILIRSDKNAEYPECPEDTGYPNGGFGMLDIEAGKCQASIDLGTLEAGSQPGAALDNACKEIMESLLDEPTLIPIFDQSLNGGGQHATFRIYGFAAFQVTGYFFPSKTHIDPLAPACTENCTGITGFFTNFVSLDDGLLIGGSPPMGANLVKLTH